MTIGSASNATIGGQPYQSSTMVPPSGPQGGVSPTGATIQAPPPSLSTSTPLMPVLDNPEMNSDIKLSTNLVKPSTFFSPPSSSPLMMPPVTSTLPTAPPLNHPGNLQRPYGAPLLQPFPPPNPPPSLTPTAAPTPNFAFITREKIREALLVLIQVCISTVSYHLATYRMLKKLSTSSFFYLVFYF